MSKFIEQKSLQTRRFECAAKSGVAEIVIYGAIGNDPWDDTAVSAKQFSDELAKLPENVKEIHLRINSGGGDVFEGVTIYERLKQHKAKVIVYVDGLAASIASIIAMAGDEIVIGEGAYMMIHRPWTMAWGNTSDFERTISLLDKLEDSMISIYSKKTGLSRAELTKMISEDFWMDATESVELKFAHRKTEAPEALHVAASILAKCNYRNKPVISAENKAVKNKLKELKAEIQNFQTRK